MSQLSLLGLYYEKDTAVHRLHPGVKLLLLFVLSLSVVIVREAWFSVLALAVVLFGVGLARMPWPGLWRSIRFVVLMLTVLAMYHAWQNGISHAVAVVVGLLALIVAATLLTATTSTDDMIDTITRGLGPFRRFGVNPEAVGLAFSLVLRFVPDVAERAFETREAARARGLDRSIRAYMTPLTIRVVARAQTMGEALQARGIGEDEN